MSRKDVQDYYNQIYVDYTDMVQALKDMEQECTNGLVSPDRVNQLKEMLEPIKINYQRISYIMYLLDKPNKKEKRRWYDNQNKNKYVGTTLKEVREENKSYIEKAKQTL